MFNDLSSVARDLATRRSGKPRDMIAPGPDGAKLEDMLKLAMRTPDHGKLFPWRFVVIDDRNAFANLLARAFTAANPEARAAQIEAAVAAPQGLLCLSTATPGTGSDRAIASALSRSSRLL